MLYIKLAWRNIFRNKRRSIIAAFAIGLGLASLIVYDGMGIGMRDDLFRMATEVFSGQAQVHKEGYRTSQKVDDYILNQDEVIQKLKNNKKVSAYALRAMSMGMITSPTFASAVKIVGVEPELERDISKFDDAILEGEYFDKYKKDALIIGKDLAKSLDVEIGDKVVITASQADSGGIMQKLFRIRGIYDLGDKSINSMYALIHIEQAQELLNIDGHVHEIAFNFEDFWDSTDSSLALWSNLSEGPNNAISWQVLMPDLVSAFGMMDFGKFIVGAIIFFLVGLMIWNTMFMSLFERFYEFGVLKAVGTRPFALGKLMVYEGLALGMISIVLGTIIGGGINYIMSHVGYDYTGASYFGVAMQEPIYPVIQATQFYSYQIWTFVAMFIISIYPAYSASKIKPAEALRKGF
ncbi:MAG: ABC transporter permease [Candidatus Zixiibacteriota bacterium]